MESPRNLVFVDFLNKDEAVIFSHFSDPLLFKIITTVESWKDMVLILFQWCLWSAVKILLKYVLRNLVFQIFWRFLDLVFLDLRILEGGQK